MEFHDKLTIPNLGRMAVMDSVRQAEDMVLEDEYAKKQTALDFYYNRNIDSHIDPFFPGHTLSQIPVTFLRVLPKFARARMMLYKVPPRRFINGEMADEYMEFTYHLDSTLRTASELAWTLGMIHVRSKWNERKQRIEYDILPNVKEYYYEGETIPFGYSYEIGKDGQGNRQFYFFSEERDGEPGLHFIFTSDEKIKAVEGNPEMINIYGVNPISRIMFPYNASDVVRCAVNCSIAFTEVMLAIRYQTGSPVMSGIDTEIPNIKFGIDRLISLPEGANLSYIAPPSNIPAMIQGIKEYLTITAQNHSLSINFAQGTTPPSGIALKIMNLENEEAREADIPLFKEFEEMRYEIDRKILEVHTGRVFDESYAVDFEESKIPLEWPQEKDKLQFMLDNGLMTKRDLYKFFNPDITEDELESKFEEIDEERLVEEVTEQPQQPQSILDGLLGE